LINAQDTIKAKVNFSTQEILIDGYEKEKVWETADEVTDFWQWFPTDNLRAEQRTVAKFLVDDINLYILIKSFSKTPDYVVPSLRRDFLGSGNDNVTIILDTFMDGTNGFMFGTNPFGVKRESLISNGGDSWDKDFNQSWDVKWETEASQQEGFTISEIKIPLKSIKYPENSTQWRVNIYRHDTDTKQWYTWANIPQNQGISGLAYTGILNFEKPLTKSTATVAIIPYVGGSVQKDFDTDERKSIFNYGGDAKLSIGSGMNLDLTINPDFSQVEVDDQIINLTRFEVTLPEKRQFFIQNSDLFANFGDRREAQPFFSRRIGVAKDTTGAAFENKIIAGVRLSGKINNNLRLGFLNMQTDKDVSNQIAANNNTVFTLQQKVLDRSNINFIFVNRQTTGNPDFDHAQDLYNRVVGVDFNLASKSNQWTGRAFLHNSFSPDQKNDAYASGVSFEYNVRSHSFNYGGTLIGDNYQSDLGFIRRTGIFKNYLRYTHRIWLDSKLLRSINLSQSLYYIGRPKENYLMTDRGLWSSIEFSFINQAKLQLRYSNRYTYLLNSFNPSRISNSESLEALSDYNYDDLELSFRSDPSGIFNYNIKSSYGGFYNGTKFSISTRMNYRIQPYFTASMRFNYDKIKLPAPYASTNLILIGPKVDVTFNKKLFWGTFFQYSSQSDNFGINSRLQWRFSPLSDFYLVYNDNYFVSDTFVPKVRSLTFKLTYWFNK
tara:strand:- start:680 stop:2836 length:2157 start_codon:yes stop_codon:yes gene_type:complete